MMSNVKDDVEFQAFVWDNRTGKYAPEGRSVGTERLCRARLQEKIDKGWLAPYLDGSKTMIMKRAVTISYGKWEEVTTEEQVMRNRNSSGSSGIGTMGVLQVVFIVLKLCGLIDWSW